MLSIREERMNDDFTKFHIDGAPLDLVLHRFTICRDEFYHNHPWGFTSTVIKGGYQESIFDAITGETVEMDRKPGDTFTVNATTVHKILGLLDGECWTLIQPQPWEQEWKFFKQENGKIYSRLPEGEWEEHH